MNNIKPKSKLKKKKKKKLVFSYYLNINVYLVSLVYRKSKNIINTTNAIILHQPTKTKTK
jgi:hypothetical protein